MDVLMVTSLTKDKVNYVNYV